MGTTFVSIDTESSANEPGFWMSDTLLELWLRLLALHLPAPTSDGTLGIEGGTFMRDIEVSALEDIGRAFLDLMDGKITGDASSTAVMPGSTPYERK